MQRVVLSVFLGVLLLLCAGTLVAQTDMFARRSYVSVPAIENAGFGNMVVGVDFDGDGKPEIYAVNHNWSDTGGELVPRIYKFEFNGTTWDSVWSATLPIAAQNTWPALTYGDWDGDGKMEIIWCPINYLVPPSPIPPIPNPPRIIVFEAVGDGSDNMGVPDGSGGWKPNAQWTIVTTDNFELRPFRAVLADVDNDGKKELIFCDRASSTTGFRFGVVGVSNIPDNGDGSETWTLKYSGKDSTLASGTVYDFAVVDSSIYLFHSASTGPITKVSYANGTWSIRKAQTGLVPQGSWKSAQVVDLDGNGTKEIVVGSGSPSGTNAKVFLLQQSGDTLVSTQIADFASLIGAGRLYGGASGDIDNDGYLDFVFGTRNAVPPASFVRLRYVGGAITSPASYQMTRIDDSQALTGGRWDMVAIANLDADADAEVVYSNGVDNLRTPLVVLDRVVVPFTNFMTIAEARKDTNADYKPDRLGERVTVSGIVNSINPTASANRFSYYMQEGNYGINITKGSVTGGGPVYKLGDKLVVNGVVGQNTGTTQLALDSVGAAIYLGSGFVLNPTTVTINSYLANPESYEGRLIKIQYVAKAATSVAWPALNFDANMTITDGWMSLVLRLDKDTDIDGTVEPTYPVNITGVATQFSSLATPNDGYQISPNFYADFEQNVAAPPQRKMTFVSPTNGARVVLNDTAQVVTFTWLPGVDLNKDTLTYFWSVAGVGSPITTGNGGLDTMIIRTGKQMRDAYLTGGKDSSQIRWTVIMREKGRTPNYAALDTFALMVVRGTITAIDESNLIPETFSLAQNYPNPFNPATTINYGLAAQATVTLTIYDILGREVATLLNDVQPAGRHSIRWEGRTGNGATVASGVYFYRLEARPVSGGNPFTDLKKMMMLK